MRSAGEGRLSRRALLRSAGALAVATGAGALLPRRAHAAQVTSSLAALEPDVVEGAHVYDLEIGETEVRIGGRRGTATTINGTLPGPLLRLREGQDTILRVTNRLEEDTSIHWHGLLVPAEMDGVPGVSFPGIRPGETFTYRFTPRQYGTYWYHSHSGLQEQLGHYGPLIIDPADGKVPYRYDREYVVLLSDWSFESPYRILDRLKKQPDYYNFQQRTIFELPREIGAKGLGPALRERLMWGRMRMNPTDVADITGATYTFLLNGEGPEAGWAALFQPGERVLLHIINSAAGTNFDVRIPGLPMTLVQAQGQYVEPVETDELRIAIAETYSILVAPSEERAYTLFAESTSRSGYARGALTPREGLVAAVPPSRERPLLTMADMGMAHEKGANGGMDHGAMPGMDEGGHDMGAMGGHDMGAMSGHDMDVKKPPSPNEAEEGVRFAVAGAVRTQGLRPPGTVPGMVEHERDRHGPGNAAVPDMVSSRVHEPGLGLGGDGWRVLTYADLRVLELRPDFRAPTREIEMHLTGNMERFMWSIDGVPFGRSEPIQLTLGERLRLTMVNDTMMSHPMHLHGMWMELENGHGERIPRVHTVNVKPAERLSVLVDVDAPGSWAFHCHVLYHMEVGMFRVFHVAPGPVASRRRPK